MPVPAALCVAEMIRWKNSLARGDHRRNFCGWPWPAGPGKLQPRSPLHADVRQCRFGGQVLRHRLPDRRRDRRRLARTAVNVHARGRDQDRGAISRGIGPALASSCRVRTGFDARSRGVQIVRLVDCRRASNTVPYQELVRPNHGAAKADTRNEAWIAAGSRNSRDPASRACGSRCWRRTSASPRAASTGASGTARRCSRPCCKAGARPHRRHRKTDQPRRHRPRASG